MTISKVAPSVQLQSSKPVAPANKCVLNPTAVKALMVTGAVLAVAGAAYYATSSNPVPTPGIYEIANKSFAYNMCDANETKKAKFMVDITRQLNVTSVPGLTAGDVALTAVKVVGVGTGILATAITALVCCAPRFVAGAVFGVRY